MSSDAETVVVERTDPHSTSRDSIEHADSSIAALERLPGGNSLEYIPCYAYSNCRGKAH
jgi:hypothetical protein